MKLRMPPKRALRAVNIILAIAVAIASLFLARNILTATLSKPPEVKTKVEGSPSSGGRQRLAHYAPILDNSVFGFPGGKLTKLSSSIAQAPPREVDITLRGTVASGRGGGHAIVEDSTGLQSVYSTGEWIIGAGVLKRVERNRILVENSGEEKVFELSDILNMEEIHVNQRDRNIPQRDRRDSNIPHGEGRTKPAKFVKRTADRSFVVDYDAVREAIENPKQIMTDARLLPNMEDGRQNGFVISEVMEGGIFDGLGLKNGDVLVRVNEFTISDPQTALQAFTALKGMERIELDIQRNGKPLTLTYVLR